MERLLDGPLAKQTGDTYLDMAMAIPLPTLLFM